MVNLRKNVLIRLSGNTPLVRVDSLSDALGIEILGKAEVRGSHVTYSSEIPMHRHSFSIQGEASKIV
jgi:hypothetical protein